jgi:hypothetical protein
MKILVRFEQETPTQEWLEAHTQIQDFYKKHPRLAFEPRTLDEITIRQQLDKMQAAQNLLEKTNIIVAEGVLFQVLPDFTHLVVADGTMFYLTRNEILSVRDADQIPVNEPAPTSTPAQTKAIDKLLATTTPAK